MALLKNEVKQHFAYMVKMAVCTVSMVMIFSVDMFNTKVVDNFLILLVLKFHDFRPAGLGVIDFTSLLSAFACALNISE